MRQNGNIQAKVVNKRMKRIARGNTAEIFDYREHLICKLFNLRYPAEYIEHEFRNASIAWKLGIRTPKAHKLITDGGRQGIVYDRIAGETLSVKLAGADEAACDRWMDRFIAFHKQLLQHHADDAVSYKDFLKVFAADQDTVARIDALDDGNSFLHGDYHPENVMIDESGNEVLIDMMNVCKGPALYDVARTYFLLRNDNKLRNQYLEKMGYSEKEIRPYLDVILLIRENEMKE